VKKLAELQRDFISDCLSGKLNENNVLSAKYIDADSISASGLMGIYQTSGIGNIINSMKLTYPVIEKLVGVDFFRATCKAFILLHWPRSANMDDYGNEFADFLSVFEHAKHLTYLEDVARLEWLFHQSSLADDAATTDWARLAKIEEDEVLQIKFKLAPSVSLIRSIFPIEKIWQMNQLDAEHGTPVDFDGSETFLLLYRNGLKIDFVAIPFAEYVFLLAFYQGLTFEKAIDNSTREQASILIDDTLHKYIKLGVISGF